MSVTFEQFTSDVRQHQMTVLVDDGVRRHLRFGKPGTFNMRFDVLTWPGHLCYTGDMGTYVFARVEDMFNFFRRSEPGPTVPLQYWAEKVLAQCKTDGIRHYTEARFREVIKDWFDEYEFDSDETRATCWAEIESEVLRYAEDGEETAREAATGYEFNGDLFFPDFWEANLTEYTGRFIWCCYALQWAIEQYDARPQPTADVVRKKLKSVREAEASASLTAQAQQITALQAEVERLTKENRQMNQTLATTALDVFQAEQQLAALRAQPQEPL